MKRIELENKLNKLRGIKDFISNLFIILMIVFIPVCMFIQASMIILGILLISLTFMGCTYLIVAQEEHSVYIRLIHL